MSPRRSRTHHTRLFAALAAIWLAACALGSAYLWQYKLDDGEKSAAPPNWPAAELARSSDRPTLVMIAHPKCPCTRASIDELGRLMAELGERVTAHVLVVRPSDAPAGWERDEIWSRAEALPGVTVTADVGGKLAERFGARTSGDTLLYGADGELLFHGGVTAARGHAGDSASRARVLAIALGQPTNGHLARVYGCPLAEPGNP